MRGTDWIQDTSWFDWWKLNNWWSDGEYEGRDWQGLKIEIEGEWEEVKLKIELLNMEVE